LRALSSPSRWFALILIVVGPLTYLNSLSNPLVLDDIGTISDNPSIESLTSPGVLMPPAELNMAGRPVVNLTLAINYALGETDPRGYRLVNLAIHVACALLLFAMAQLLLQKAGVTSSGRHTTNTAFAIALLWLVHPLNSEVIDYLTQRTETMMALFCLLTLYAAIRASAADRRWSLWHTVAVLACAIGMATKESMGIVPVLALLMDAIFLAGSWRAALRQRAPLYLSLAATWIILAGILWSGPRTLSAGFGSGVSPWNYLLNQAPMIVRYLRLAFWPDALVANYGWPIDLTLVDVLPQMMLIGALLGLTLYALWRHPKAGFIGAWFFITLAPASSIVPVATEVGAERRMYLPLMAVITLAVLAMSWLWKVSMRDLSARLPRLPAIAAVVVLVGVSTASALTTVARNREYTSAVTLAQLNLERYPTPVAHHSLAEVLLDAGRHNEAMTHLRLAIPGAPRAYFNLGIELYKEGRLSEAIGPLQTFVAKQPKLAYVLAARGALGQIFVARENWPAAIEQFQAILAINPDHPTAHLWIGDALLAIERFDDAILHYRQYLAGHPADAAALNQLAIALGSAGKFDEAALTLEAVVRLTPHNAGAEHNLALSLGRAGRVADAIVHARQAVALQPDNADSQTLLRQLTAAGR
jgi:protein O-mannosyl-transferase